MSTEDMTILDLLQDDVKAESNDHNKYIKLAEQADEEFPNRCYGGILRDIAYEEEIHHKHLMSIIEDIKKHGYHNHSMR